MTWREIISFVDEMSVRREHPFDRDHYWISKEAFESIKSQFKSEVNWIHQGKSYRSKHVMRHVHAIDQGAFVFVHRDNINPTRHLALFPLLPVHICVDLVPFLVYCVIKRKNPRYYWE